MLARDLLELQRIEDTYHVAKRLLGLAFFWTGAENGVELKVWATWLAYGVLVDLTNAVAAALHRPVAAISLEMVYRGLYYFGQAYQPGTATNPVGYLAANAKQLRIIKHKRKPDPLPALRDLTKPGEPQLVTNVLRDKSQLRLGLPLHILSCEKQRMIPTLKPGIDLVVVMAAAGLA